MEGKVEIEVEKSDKSKQKITPTIFGIRLWRILAYFIIYSVIGFVIETLFAIATKGVLESRQSFLYGPFCGIYGIGAVVMIIALQYFKKNNITLFIGGYIVGSLVEYLISLIGEFLFHIKWWDYSSMPFNVNGRICFAYSLFWGILGVILMSYVNKKVDKFIDFLESKMSKKTYYTMIITIIIFLLLDCIVTGMALKMFFSRLVEKYDLKIQNVIEYTEEGKELYSIEIFKNIANHFFTDKKMLKTFPNLKLISEDGSIIYVDSILNEIQPYYLRVFETNNK